MNRFLERLAKEFADCIFPCNLLSVFEFQFRYLVESELSTKFGRYRFRRLFAID